MGSRTTHRKENRDPTAELGLRGVTLASPRASGAPTRSPVGSNIFLASTGRPACNSRGAHSPRCALVEVRTRRGAHSPWSESHSSGPPIAVVRTRRGAHSSRCALAEVRTRRGAHSSGCALIEVRTRRGAHSPRCALVVVVPVGPPRSGQRSGPICRAPGLGPLLGPLPPSLPRLVDAGFGCPFGRRKQYRGPARGFRPPPGFKFPPPHATCPGVPAPKFAHARA